MRTKNFKLIFYVLFIFVSTYVDLASAQTQSTFKIEGKFVATPSNKMGDLTIQLLDASKKTLIKIEFVDQDGKFRFDDIKSGKYTIHTQSMYFSKYQSDTIHLTQNIDLGAITLNVISKQLNEVIVTATKPLIQQQYDKTIVNVSSSITAVGSNALEVLQKAPGITLDQNDNIAMRGRQGVLVMIDGKLVPMNGQDLANFLKTTSANDIERIELITNPSAKYDAAGNSGIIDIRMKKGLQSGINGSATLSYGQGKFSKFNPSLNLNAKGKKLNTFLTYSYGNNVNFTKLDIDRGFYNGADQTGGIYYINDFNFNFKSHNLRIGTDYSLNKNITIGAVLTGNFVDGRIQSDSRAQSFNQFQQSTGFFNTLGNNGPDRNNRSANINYRHTLNNTGSEFGLDLDYAKFFNNDIQNYTTLYFNSNQQPSANNYLLEGDLGGELSIKSIKLDFTHPLKKSGIKLETGLKSSWVTNDNDVKFYNKSSGSKVIDAGKSNHFIYDENINAAYLNGSKSWKKLSVQFGLRVENTIANGLQVVKDERFNRNYTQLFPSGFLGYKFSENHDFGLSLSRRINRPSYRELNPFKVFLDPLTYSGGNPNLKPELTNSLEADYTFKGKYNLKANYSRTTDNILSVLSPDTEPQTVIQTGRNLAKFDYYSLSMTVPLSISKWLNSTNNILGFYGEYKGFLVNTNLNQGRISMNLNSNNSIVINKNTTAEVNFNYQSRTYYGFLDVNNNWNLSLGIQRSILNKKGSLKLNLNDVFYTNKINASNRTTGYGEDFYQRRDSRVANIAFTYKFGKVVQGNKRKNGGAEDEKRRAN